MKVHAEQMQPNVCLKSSKTRRVLTKTQKRYQFPFVEKALGKFTQFSLKLVIEKNELRSQIAVKLS